MPKGNETTTKFKVDISELKAGIQEANRQIALANSEFKKASAGMESWGKDADGLSAKLTQLKTVTSQYETILEELKKQYTKVVKEQGENSQGAVDLKIKMNALEGAIKGNNAAISRYEKQLSDLKSGTKDAETAMDKLKSTISQQESELDSLKSAYANVVLEQGKNSKEARDLAGQIEKLSMKLQQNKSEMSEASNAADDLDRSLDDVGDSAKDASGGFTVLKGALADLIADGIRATVDMLKEFAVESDGSYKKFQAATGASAKEMQGFKEEMNDLYKNAYGESLEDIGDKMAYIKQVTGETDPTKIKELAENAMTLEDTFGSDFSETIRGVNNLMKHFGIDATEAFDLFAKGSQNGLDYTNELGDNIAEYGGNFQQAGYSAQEYFQLLENGTKNGAYNLDKVNDSINEVKNRLGDGTIEKNIDIFSQGTQDAFTAWQNGKGTMKDVINSIVGDINNCENEQEALNMAATAFGTMGEDANLKVVKSLTTVGDSYKDVAGTMEQMKEIRYDDVATQFTELGRKLKLELLTPIAEAIMPALKGLVDFMISAIPVIGQAFSSVLGALKEWLPVIAGIGTAIATYFVVGKILAFVEAIRNGTLALKLMQGAQAALNVVMNLNPIGLIVAAIAGLVAAFVILWNKSEAFRNFWLGLWDGIKNAASVAADWIKNAWQTVANFFTTTIPQAFSTFINAVVSFFTSLPERIGAFLTSVITSVTTWAANLIAKGKEAGSNFVTNLVNFFTDLPNKIGYCIGAVIGIVVSFVVNMTLKAIELGKNFLTNVVNFFQQLPGKIASFIQSAYAKITSWVANSITKAKEMGSKFLSAVVSFFTQLPGKVASFLTSTIQKVVSWAANMVSKAKSTGSDFVNGVINFVKNLPSKISSAISGAISAVVTWGSNLVAKGRQAASDLTSAIVNGVKGIPSKMADIGKNIVTGLWNGINNMTDWIISKIKGFGDSVLSGIKDFFKIKSPSRVMRDVIGENLVRGIAVGIEKNTKVAVQSIKEMGKKLMPEMDGINTDLQSVTANVRGGIKNTSQSIGGTGGNGSGGPQPITQNFYQYNNSPKPLNRLEIYRQTRNQLAAAGGV